MPAPLVEVPEAPDRAALIDSLDAARIRWRPGAGAEVVVHADGRPPVLVRLWRDPRSRPQTNPFSERAIRHIVGTLPTIDPQYLGSTVGVIARNSYLPLSSAIEVHDDLEEHHLATSDDRSPLLSRFEEFLRRAGCHSRVVTSMLTLADELVTNAIYNAPLENGVRLFASASRTVRVPCRRPVLVRWGHDGTHFAVAVRDAYGSLTPEEVMDNLFRCHQMSDQRIEEKRGGAGLGLYMLVQNSSRVIFNIEPGAFTEVIVLRRSGQSWRDFLATTPTINLCSKKDVVDKRRHRRLPVRWTAEVMAGGRRVPADVLDVSSRGAFIVPAGGMQLIDGARAELTILSDIVHDRDGWSFGHPLLPLTLRAIARWGGDSRRHDKVGNGLQFEEERPELAEIVAELAKKT